MSVLNEQFYRDFIDDVEDVANMDLSNIQNDSLDDFLEPFQTNEVRPHISLPSSILNSSYTKSASNSLCTDPLPCDVLKMVEQPFQSSKLRYRTDYIRETSRLGALVNKNRKSKKQGPAIHIPKCYLNLYDEYYIRVSLVTINYPKTNLHYFHPYELEDPKNETFNDRANNSVWFPIEAKDSIKHFPLLRIVKKKILDTQKLDRLRIFDYYNEILLNQTDCHHYLQREMDTIKEYNLEKSQLAFTIGKKILNNGQLSMHIYPKTTIFSDPMDEYNEKQSDTDTDTESSSDKNTSSSFSNQYIYKYAPRSSINGDNDEMLIFLKKKLEPKKHGVLQVIFEGNTSKGRWSQSILNVDIKDRMISFKIPIFPEPIVNPTNVDIILRQEHRMLGVLKYSYLPVRY